MSARLLSLEKLLAYRAFFSFYIPFMGKSELKITGPGKAALICTPLLLFMAQLPRGQPLPPPPSPHIKLCFICTLCSTCPHSSQITPILLIVSYFPSRDKKFENYLGSCVGVVLGVKHIQPLQATPKWHLHSKRIISSFEVKAPEKLLENRKSVFQKFAPWYLRAKNAGLEYRVRNQT